MSEGPIWTKKRHAPGCNGAMCRQRGAIEHVDRLGRIGNGGVIAHVYFCNRSWDGCPAFVLVAESFMQQAAEAAATGGAS